MVDGPCEKVQDRHSSGNTYKTFAKGSHLNTNKSIIASNRPITNEMCNKVRSCADNAVNSKLAFDDRVQACCKLDKQTPFEVANIEIKQANIEIVQGLRCRRC